MKIAGHHWLVRDGTNDAHIIEEVCVHNTYRLPPSLPIGSVVIDIGAHIGAFAVACLDRGAAVVYAFEADPENASLARAHLAPYGARAQIYQLAVVRSDVTVGPQYLESYPFMDWCGLHNTGGQSTLADQGPIVETITFDEVVRLVLGRSARPIDLAKLDCQGSEWPILFTARELPRVRTLVGEFQEMGRPGAPPIPAAMGPGLPTALTGERLAAHLRAHGFAVELAMTATDPTHTIGLFFARQEHAC